MLRTGFTVRLAAMVMGLAAMPAPAFSQEQEVPQEAQQPPGTLPSNISDFRCLVAVQNRQTLILGNDQMDEAQRVEIANNLIIISAFFAGRITHYPTVEAADLFNTVQAELEATTPEQRDRLVQSCADFYLSVMELLADIQQGPQEQQ